MRVVVTGGAGFIGSHLVDALLATGHEVMVIDDLSTGDLGNVNPAAAFRQLDIRIPAAGEVIRRWRPEVVSHHAAQMSVSRSVREPLLDADINLHGSLLLLEAARDVGARFVFASSGGALYGHADVLPTDEDQPPRPVSPYAVSKLAFEHYLGCYGALHALSHAVLRYANVYGPRQNPHGEAGVVALFCKALMDGRPVVINGDGCYTRDYVYVDDVVRANLLALNSHATGPFNVGTGRQVDVNQLFQLVSTEFGAAVEPTRGPPRPGDVRASALNCERIAKALGWRPRITLEAGLRRTAEWVREHASAAAGGVDRS
jgi:UDP-glucose 4-epimerase